MLAIELLILMVPVVLCVRVCVCVCVCVYVCAQLARNLFVFFAASSSSCAPFVAFILSVVHFRSLSLVDCNLRIILLLHAYFYIYIYTRTRSTAHTHIWLCDGFVCVCTYTYETTCSPITQFPRTPHTLVFARRF